MREKRTAQVRANIPPSLKEQLELFRADGGNVISISDYIASLIRRDIAHRIAEQSLGGRRRIS